jgi:alpha-galactosidase
MKKVAAIVVFCLSTYSLFAQKFDLAKTPPMGWNSWNTFACDVNEDIIRQTVDAIVSNGMKDAGYIYVNIDDCWHGDRDSLGFIHEDKQRFPSGMKALADYVHSKGLKLGIYSDAGWQTCGGRPGSRGYEYQDAMQYAKWGIDYLKYDWCNTEGLNAEGAYLTMRDAIYKAGRPMVFSMCEWGNSSPWLWARDIGHSWRTTGDIWPCFDCEYNHGSWSSWGVMKIVDMRGDLREYAGPGHWNDFDMMEVGNGMTVAEDRSHFTLWCMLASPLIAGNDLSAMSAETRKILTNKNAIAINQDSLGIQTMIYSKEDSLDILFKPLTGNEWAVCFLNRSSGDKDVKFSWADHMINDTFAKRQIDFKKSIFNIFDIWNNKDAGTTKKMFSTKLASHDVKLLRLTMK